MGPILVFAAAEAVTRHHDPAAKQPVLIIKCRQRTTLFGEKHARGCGASVGVQIVHDLRPIERLHPAHNARRADFRCCHCALHSAPPPVSATQPFSCPPSRRPKGPPWCPKTRDQEWRTPICFTPHPGPP